MLVLNSRDRHEYLWLPPKDGSTEQPYNDIFRQNTTIKSISTMLLAP